MSIDGFNHNHQRIKYILSLNVIIMIHYKKCGHRKPRFYNLKCTNTLFINHLQSDLLKK